MPNMRQLPSGPECEPHALCRLFCLYGVRIAVEFVELGHISRLFQSDWRPYLRGQCELHYTGLGA